MNAYYNLQAAITRAADASVKAEVLESATRLWANLHGESAALGAVAESVRDQLTEIQDYLKQVEESLVESLADSEESAQESRAKPCSEQLEGVRDTLDEANAILSALGATLGPVSAENAGAKLVAIVRRKIFEAIDSLNEVLA